MSHRANAIATACALAGTDRRPLSADERARRGDRPVNLGNPAELSIGKLAERIIEIAGSSPRVGYGALPSGNPMQRQPDIALARKLSDRSPTVASRTACGERSGIAGNFWRSERGLPRQGRCAVASLRSRSPLR
jgi:hypothetical protein